MLVGMKQVREFINIEKYNGFIFEIVMFLLLGIYVVISVVISLKICRELIIYFLCSNKKGIKKKNCVVILKYMVFVGQII